MKPLHFYRPEYFQIYELVPKAEFREYDESELWMIFDPFLLIAADSLRARYGAMIVNDWHNGGWFEFSGWRPPGCEVGADLSMHRFGKALDLKPAHITAERIRRDMKKNPDDSTFKYIVRVEDNKSWLHIDRANTMNMDNDGIIFFNG